MRITKQKLINLIKEELANEVSLEEATPAKIPGLPAVGGAAAKPDAPKDAVNPSELAKTLMKALKAGSPGEDQWLESLIELFAAAAADNTVDTDTNVKRFTGMLMKALKGMAKSEEEPEKSTSSYSPRSTSGGGGGMSSTSTRQRYIPQHGRGADSTGRAGGFAEGKVTKNALEDLIKEAVAELINK